MTEIELDASKKATPGKSNTMTPKECQGIRECIDSITHLNGKREPRGCVVESGMPTMSYWALGAWDFLFSKSKIFNELKSCWAGPELLTQHRGQLASSQPSGHFCPLGYVPLPSGGLLALLKKGLHNQPFYRAAA